MTDIPSKSKDLKKMDIIAFKKKLKAAGLKLTTPRKMIWEFLDMRDEAVTYAELSQLTEKQTGIDRVTIYRTLKSFEEIGLLHRVFTGEGLPHYVLIKDVVNPEANGDQQHLYFCCITCKGVFVLDDIIIPDIRLPEQYNVISLEMTINGICKKCKDKKRD